MAQNEKQIWEEYTLFDFLKILKLDVSSEQAKDEYYKFVATINRFNRLLEHLYCNECNEILYPINDSDYAHYRVVRFRCENLKCSKSDKTNKENEIYLHHCLNGHCNGIIDSRESKKCPNGLYICSNKECGCCCSHDMLNRRLENLNKTGGYIHPDLIFAVENKLGHLERAEHFCYICGNLMKEIHSEVFFCDKCKIQYDLKDNHFKRPHSFKTKSNPTANMSSDDYYFDDNML
jgi:uncharacterized protein YbaR (Trm112 family)